jgi:hypothetical protein
VAGAANEQRGTGFTRASTSGSPDIGACGVQQNDIIFGTDFEGYP